MKNSSQKLKKDEVLVARTICNLHSCYIKNSLIFSQSDVRKFFIYGILFI